MRIKEVVSYNNSLFFFQSLMTTEYYTRLEGDIYELLLIYYLLYSHMEKGQSIVRKGNEADK